MYVIAVMTLLGYLLIWLSARREPLPEKAAADSAERWMRPFRRMSYWLLRQIYGRRRLQEKSLEDGKWKNGQVVRDLAVLYPGRESMSGVQQYYVKKLAFSMAILLAGTILGTAVSWQAKSGGILDNGRYILRGDYRDEDADVQLNASVEGWEDWTFELNVGGRIPQWEEADSLEKEFWELMTVKALGANPSWDQVYEDLNFADGLKGYPFSVEWSSESGLIDWEGKVRNPEMDVEVVITAVVSLDDWEWQHTLTANVIPKPLTEAESVYQELEEYVKQLEKDTNTESRFSLPDTWQGQSVTWREEKENYGILLWLLVTAAGVVIFFLQDKDLHTRVQEREQRLKEAYPVVVNKLVLYLGAGLTIRGALMHMANTYNRGRQQGKKEEAVYEEILCTCRELQTGVSEAEAYERMGKRCGIQEYIRLSALLSQNLRKGSGTLPARLREEAEFAERAQMNECRRKGEEVSTRLLVPMVMMLGIVMVMIMIPAFAGM